MVRKLVRVPQGWALPLTDTEMRTLGVQPGGRVLVAVEDDTPPRLVVCRAPTREEAMESVLNEHEEILRTLATTPHHDDPLRQEDGWQF
jgi:hypothetical protein